MKARNFFFFLLVTAIGFSGCEKDHALERTAPAHETQLIRPDIGLQDLIKNADLTVTVTERSPGYHAEAKGKGVIPSGEYAGWHFQIRIEGNYSAIDTGTLISGSALVKMRSERFESTMDPALQSFCCGEGGLLMLDGDWIFYMYGQVIHTTASPPHNHLFAALANSNGTMNMNIVDQSGTIVIPADPPHDPGIGLLEGFSAQHVNVTED